jgi:hypothetical protein
MREGVGEGTIRVHSEYAYLSLSNLYVVKVSFHSTYSTADKTIDERCACFAALTFVVTLRTNYTHKV